MPQLHARGVDVVVELLDAADHVERLTPAETKALLKEAAIVLGRLVGRMAMAVAAVPLSSVTATTV